MRICIVSQALPYLPSRGGFRLYGANLIRCLSQRHEIDLISLLQEGDRDHLDWPSRYCSHVETIEVARPPLSMRAANFLAGYASGRGLHQREKLAKILFPAIAAGRWDAIHFEGGYVASLVGGRLHVPAVLSLHDSWTLRCREMRACARTWNERLYYAALAAREPRFERQLYPQFDSCTVVADPDLAELRRVVPGLRAELIPYGTDAEYFRPLPVEKQPANLVFHGHLGYAPNIEAVTEFAHEIFPLVRRHAPAATFHIIGADPAPQVRALVGLDGVELSENLPDVRPGVCAGSIYVCPIRHGTGLKSKVLEAMAMRMPIVAYHPGSTVGIDCAHDEHLMAAETPEAFAQHVLTLLREPLRADRLAKAARALVAQKYSWESRAAAYENLYRRLQAERIRAA